MEFKYVYLEGEHPEERLRNKLQPLFSLVDILKEGGTPSPKHLEIAEVSKEDIRNLLSDMVPFYSVKKIEFTSNNTLPEVKDIK